MFRFLIPLLFTCEKKVLRHILVKHEHINECIYESYSFHTTNSSVRSCVLAVPDNYSMSYFFIYIFILF